MDFDQDRTLFRKFTNPFEASYEDAEPALQLKLIYLYYNDKLKSKFKEGICLTYKCVPKDKYPNMQQKAIACASLFGSTFVNKLPH